MSPMTAAAMAELGKRPRVIRPQQRRVGLRQDKNHLLMKIIGAFAYVSVKNFC